MRHDFQKVTEHQIRVLILSTTFVRNTSRVYWSSQFLVEY